MLENHIQDVIKLAGDTIAKVDKINQRLITAIIVTVICFALTTISMTFFYFTTDYGFGSQQIQSNTENSSQTITKGGNK